MSEKPHGGSVEEESRYWIKSVGRAMDVLTHLAAHGGTTGLSVTEIAAALGLSKSATFAILYTLNVRGMVQDEGTGMSRRYRLGMTLARMGAIASENVDLRSAARPHMQALAEAVGATARLALFLDQHAVVIEQATGNERVRLDLQLGSAESLTNTSLGKAILASMPPESALAIVEAAGLERSTDRSIVDVEKFMEHLESVRTQGYAINDEEDAPGVFGVAAPVLNAQGDCVAALTITGLIRQVQDSWSYDEMGREVMRAAMAISADLGYQVTSRG